MRALVVALGLLAFVAIADAKPRAAKQAPTAKVDKKKPASKKKPTRAAKKKKRIGKAAKRPRYFVFRGPVSGQSLGAPWLGRLREAVKLPDNDGYYIRRPHRAYGTSTTIAIVERILLDVAYRFPDIHDIAVGDISAERGGHISEHSSHQSGRDVDLGLIFVEKPAGYPESFVNGNADNLDLEATFVLVEEFAKTAGEPGGVHMIFLDYDVQGLLYHWALENGETEEYLRRLFQYPHGRGVPAGIVRHEPMHADHLHVRFRCQNGDSACR